MVDPNDSLTRRRTCGALLRNQGIFRMLVLLRLCTYDLALAFGMTSGFYAPEAVQHKEALLCKLLAPRRTGELDSCWLAWMNQRVTLDWSTPTHHSIAHQFLSQGDTILEACRPSFLLSFLPSLPLRFLSLPSHVDLLIPVLGIQYASASRKQLEKQATWRSASMHLGVDIWIKSRKPATTRESSLTAPFLLHFLWHLGVAVSQT